MKKIIIISLFLILVTGCADYKELNALSYVTGIGIDYQEDEFIVTFEIMDNKKENNTISTETFTVNAKSENIYEAFIKVSEKLSATPYFSHTQVLILSEKVVNKKLDDVTDFVIRNPKLNEEFQFVITKENTPEEIFNTTSKEYPAASFYIYSLVNDNTYSENYYIHLPFAIFIQQLNEHKMDPVVSIIKSEDDLILLDDSAAFSNGKLTSEISTYDANLYNALIKDQTEIVISENYLGESVESSINFENTTLTVDNDLITIKVNAVAEIKKSPTTLNIDDNDSFEIVEKIYEESLTSDIESFIKTCQKNNTDLLGLENIYYINSRKENKDLWLSANIKIEVNVSVSRKGLVYNVYN